MNDQVIYNTIKELVQTNLPDSRVLLFGSRARGDYDRYSDYDLLIITRHTLSAREKLNWSTKLDKAITYSTHIPIDLLINSEEEVREKQELPGHIIRSAMREAIAL